MGIGELAKVRGSRVIGIDSSTKSLAFAVFEDGKPIKCGEVQFEGDFFHRLADAKTKTRALVASGDLRADYVAIEASIFSNSQKTAIDLSMVLGAIISELMDNNPEVHRIHPITWQSGIGNPNLKQDEKAQLRRDNPGMKQSWYLAKGRKIRKQRTLDIAQKYFDISNNSDNVGDAVGLALYATQTLTRQN